MNTTTTVTTAATQKYDPLCSAHASAELKKTPKNKKIYFHLPCYCLMCVSKYVPQISHNIIYANEFIADMRQVCQYICLI